MEGGSIVMEAMLQMKCVGVVTSIRGYNVRWKAVVVVWWYAPAFGTRTKEGRSEAVQVRTGSDQMPSQTTAASVHHPNR